MILSMPLAFRPVLRPLNRRERWLVSARLALTTMSAIALLGLGLLVAFTAEGTKKGKSDGTKCGRSDGLKTMFNGADDNCACPCNCVVPGNPNANSYMLVSISPNASCCNFPGGSTQLVDYPGTWCAVQRQACLWEYNCTVGSHCHFTAGHYNAYNASNCAGSAFTQILWGLGIRVIKAGNKWSLVAWSNLETFTVADGGQYIYVPCCSGTTGNGDACLSGTVTYGAGDCGASCGGNTQTVDGCITGLGNLTGYVLSASGSFSFTLQDTPC